MSARAMKWPSVAHLCDAMERIAPTWAAADWDNVGLLVGDRTWPARRVLLSIDMTAVVLDEATRGKFDVILAYHPPIFRAVKRLVPNRAAQDGLAAEALARHIAVYSPHTALDAAPGGTNETLAVLAGLTELTPFESVAEPSPTCKLVVFVPDSHVDRVAEAVFAAGAGQIGDYGECSFRLRGEGTFFGKEATRPVVGKKGRLERVSETRLEVVFPERLLGDVTTALRQVHPYEEPAFDVYRLRSSPDGRIGQGRIGRFTKPVTLGALAKSLTGKTGASNATIVGRPGQRLRRGLVCVGAAGSLPFELPAHPCREGDVILTGEIRHHDALRYQRCGAAAIALGHWASERLVLKPLAARLRRETPAFLTTVSRKDCDPFGTTS